MASITTSSTHAPDESQTPSAIYLSNLIKNIYNHPKTHVYRIANDMISKHFFVQNNRFRTMF